MSGRIAVGVDLGGTKTLVIVLSDAGDILAQEQTSTNRYALPDDVLGNVAALIRRVMAQARIRIEEIAGIGIGVAGLVDKKRILTDSIILPRWFSINVGAWLSRELHTKVKVDNDATMAALSEWWSYKEINLETLLCLTLGTGVGAAVIINGQPLRGADGTAGQLGHMTVDMFGRICACGSKGCLNAYISGTAIAERYIERATSNTEVRHELKMSEKNLITGHWVAEASLRGDSIAKEVIEETSLYLGVGIANLVNIFNPDVIAVGGGVSELGEILLEPARAVLRERAFHSGVSRVRVKRAHYGALSGSIGAAVAVFMEDV
jgi:glucokinase